MKDHNKLNIAIALLTNRIVETMKKQEENNSKNLNEELDILLQEREELYKGNEEVIEKIIKEYKTIT